MTININKLSKNFINIENIANIHILKCFKTLFKKESILYNIGFYIVLLILIFTIICMIIFYLYQIHVIKEKINALLFAIESIQSKKTSKSKDITKKLNNLNRNRNNNNINDENINKLLIKTKKKKKVKNFISLDIDSINKEKNSLKKPNTNFINKRRKRKRNKIKEDELPKKNYNETKFIISSNNNINKGIEENIDEVLNTKDKDKNKNKAPCTLNSKTKNDKINIKNKKAINNVEDIMKLNVDQINVLSYDLALKKDKRSYCQYYISLVQTKHPIIFSFVYKGDYNSKIMKINLFFVSFIADYAVTAIFYNDDTMHQIYTKKGAYDIEYEIPKIIYSSLISIFLNLPLKILALSNDNIIEFKSMQSKENVKLKYNQLNNKLNMKFISYFIISYILLVFFWYYLSMFCAIYKSTQIHLIKDTLISFSLSLIYPFGIYLLPGIFRMASLSNPKNKRELLYKFSLILQLF